MSERLLRNVIDKVFWSYVGPYNRAELKIRNPKYGPL